MKKKVISLALALVTCLGLLPMTAMAAGPVTLTDGNLSLTIADVLFEEDVTFHFNDYGEEHDETVHVYHVAEAYSHRVTVANHGETVGYYEYSSYGWDLTLEDGVWTATDGGGMNHEADEEDAWASAASWDLMQDTNLGPYYPSGALCYTYISIKDGNRNETIDFFCVAGDQPLAASQPEKPAEPEEPAESEKPVQTKTANPTNDKLAVNGVEQAPTVYKIGGSNFFKIRDIAAMLNGTEKQFAVGYANGKVTVTSGQPYEATGKELAGAPDSARDASPSNDTVIINGTETGVTVYKIGGANYFKLRDLGKALDFYVGWEAGHGVYIETDKPYS